jgi:methylglutaconyl-CoA hydratase
VSDEASEGGAAAAGGLIVERQGAIARVSLARPEVRNAFNAELIGALFQSFSALAAEPPEALRGVVLSGDGPVFCAGADVTWQRAARDLSQEENEADATRLADMLAVVDECPVPVVARVHGAALGGGMGLCAVADTVLAEAGTTFGFTETRLGIMPAVISPFVLARIGEGNARALFPGGERFDAERALRIGLVHEVLPDATALDARVQAVIAALLESGPTASRAAKAMLRAQRGIPPLEARRITVRLAARQRASPEGQEGLSAFLEKRPPSWSPRRSP